MSRFRRSRFVALVVLVAAALPAVHVPAGAIPARPAGRPAAQHAGGTGVLPNMQAEGAALIRLLAGAFDPLQGRLPAPGGIPLVDDATLPGSVAQYWLAQVRDLRFPEAQAAIQSAGATLAGYVPDNTYMVRATPAQRDRIAASGAIRWIGYYQPAWRVPVAAGGRKGLLELTGVRTYRVHVFRVEPDPLAVGRALAGMPGVRVLTDAGVAVDVRATSAQVPAIASLPAVEWVGVKPTGTWMNSNARWVNDTGVRDLYSATKPGRLTGAGQTAGIADTAINYKEDLNGRAHIGFSDCDASGCKEAIYTQVTPGNSTTELLTVQNNATAHRKMVAFFDIGETGPNPYDLSTHGSHTGGSVDGDQPPYGTWTGNDGMAPAAMHVHQNVGTTSGGLSLPADDYQLWRQAYRPRNPGSVAETSGPNGNPNDYGVDYRPLEDARTHNNSYGLIAPIIDEGSAIALDQFVWDHEDMVVVVSAGNGGPEPGTVGSPAVAKNDITSGASANGRQPMASIDSMASFSSHGPTGDGRLGVDLATPGQIVVSAKGGSERDYHVAQGTSMSGPILSGLATLVRQYFWDGYGPAAGRGFGVGSPSLARRHNPSAALVKAALANGAVRMRGWYTGDDGTTRALDGQWPSMGQGFGQVNLDNSLFFANDPVNNYYADVYRADAQSFKVSATLKSRTVKIKVQPGAPLDVTLAWTDAPNLLPGATPSLVNNLNLRVIAPNGTLYKGNQTNSRLDPTVAEAASIPNAMPNEKRNNLERVRIPAPAAGTWKIQIAAPVISMGNQGFAIAASGRISAVGGSFTPGPALQVDQPGGPTISGAAVEPASADSARITFSTNEPTTATATLTDDGNTVTFIDSYNLGSGPLPGAPPTDTGYYGLDDGPVETSAQYANRPVVGTKHEILLTGLNPGQAYSISLSATDLAGNQVGQAISHTSPSGVYQPNAPDIGQLVQGTLPIDPAPAGWKTGTQLYAGASGGAGLLGAYMFRIPEAAIDPAAITSASVEMVSTHDWVPRYVDDPVFTVDLLNESFEPNWGTQDYTTIHNAVPAARVYPETTHKVGNYQRYAFTFRCSDLQALKDTLSTVAGAQRKAAFRWDVGNQVDEAIFATDFGFNRRSQGANLRPRLVLFTGNANPYGEACDPATPAPAISDVGIHDGLSAGAVTVSWRTDVRSDSMVLFREQGTTPWTQVGTPARSTLVHHVQVFGLDSSKEYEFVVRSAACNGATTTDTNGGEGYDFYFHAPDPGPRTEHASYTFDATQEGWTVESSSGQAPPSVWERRAPGAEGSPNGWHVSPYSDLDTTSLISPAVTVAGAQVGVEFQVAHDTEPTFDFLYVEYSSNGGSSWTTAAAFDGQSAGYPAYTPRDVRFNHPNPGGALQIRFRFTSDELISSPAYLGVSVDQVKVASYPNPLPGQEEQPLTGPVPPPSAGASGLAPPATRTGAANAADIAAGTGACVIPA